LDVDLKACLELHTRLDEVFATTGEVERLPALIGQVGRCFVPCQFISMWLYEPAENCMVNLIARYAIDGNGAADVRTGQVRLAVARGEGKGFLENLTADVLDGVGFEDMPSEQFIINERSRDPRRWPDPDSGGGAERAPCSEGPGLDVRAIRSELYAPMIFNGFLGMLCALNHPRDAFTMEHYELLRVLANKAAVAVWSIRERQRAEAESRLAMLGRAVDLVRHEMQSPLTIMKGASHVMRQILRKEGRRDGRDDEVLSEMIEMISSEVDRNAGVLDHIREYCKPTMCLRLETASLDAFLEGSHEAILLAVQSARRGKASLQLDLSGDLPPIAFSPLHLLGVLRNLVRNACEVGATSIIISTEGREDHVALRVEDDGGGVDERVLETLFVPYESTKAMAGGSGLGLFLCRRVIEEGHGGTVHAANLYEEGQRRGLRVELRLPL
jgi:signal transduction histidine kinase